MQGVGNEAGPAEGEPYSKQFEVRACLNYIYPTAFPTNGGSSHWAPRALGASPVLDALPCCCCLQRHTAMEALQKNMKEEYRAVLEFDIAFRHTR